MNRIVITPDHPAFAACSDCDWETAERIAADLGSEHVDAVLRAAALAEAEALLDDIDDGWDAVSPDADDEYIERMLGASALRECRAYRDGRYDGTDAEARAAARAELRGIIRAMSV